MRVLVNATAVPTGGGSWRYASALLRALSHLDFDSEYVVVARPDTADLCPDAPNFHFWPVPWPWNRRRLLRALWEQSVLALQARTWQPSVFFSLGNVDVPLASLLGMRSVVTMHVSQPWALPGTYPLPATIYLNVLGRLSARSADIIITISDTTRQELIRALHIPPPRIVAIWEGADCQHFAPGVTPLPPGQPLRERGVSAPYLLSVSYHYSWKNFPRLIKAYAECLHLSERPEHLVIVGRPADPSAYAKARHVAHTCRVADRVHLFTDIEDEELPAIYHGARLYVFPSYFEGFGLTQIEAMTAGVPLAASRASVIPEISGDAAIYFDPFDVSDMAKTILRGLTDEAVRAGLRERGFQRAAQFTWDRTARETLAVLRQVASKRSFYRT
jgi:glycosyltransferase involved in cell wall biosynthesis